MKGCTIWAQIPLHTLSTSATESKLTFTVTVELTETFWSVLATANSMSMSMVLEPPKVSGTAIEMVPMTSKTVVPLPRNRPVKLWSRFDLSNAAKIRLEMEPDRHSDWSTVTVSEAMLLDTRSVLAIRAN